MIAKISKALILYYAIGFVTFCLCSRPASAIRAMLNGEWELLLLFPLVGLFCSLVIIPMIGGAVRAAIALTGDNDDRERFDVWYSRLMKTLIP